jgi:hypothetical protein
MKANTFEKTFLKVIVVINIIVLILALRKPPIKDWVIVYLFNAVTNIMADNVLTALKIVRYPVRFFPKLFHSHILFDALVYPTATVLYNQMTYKDKPFAILYKVFFFAIPALLIEIWAEKTTSLIKWSKKWKWYHSFLGLILNSLINRLVIGLLRKMSTEGSDRGVRPRSCALKH